MPKTVPQPKVEAETSGERLPVTGHGQPALKVLRRLHSSQELLDRLRGTVLAFDRPTEPVGAEDWEDAQ